MRHLILILVLILIAAPATALKTDGHLVAVKGSEVCVKTAQQTVVYEAEHKPLGKLLQVPPGGRVRLRVDGDTITHANPGGLFGRWRFADVDPSLCLWSVSSLVQPVTDTGADRAELCAGLGVDCSSAPKGLFSMRRFASWAAGKIKEKVLESCPNLSSKRTGQPPPFCAPCPDVLEMIDSVCGASGTMCSHHGPAIFPLAATCGYTGGSK